MTSLSQVLQSNAVAGSLSHINVMFGSSNSYYNTKRFQGNDARAGRPTSSKKNVMTKQHLSAFHSQVLSVRCTENATESSKCLFAPPGFTSHGIQSPALSQQSEARRICVRMRHALPSSLFVLNQECLTGSIRC